MVLIMLCCLHLASIVGGKDNSKNVYRTKPIITRGCHMVSLDTHSINQSLENNNVTNCYQFCFFNNSGLTVNALLMKGMECVCRATTPSTSFDTATRCTESCPGNSNERCGGEDTNAYAVYEIENITSKHKNVGCGHVKFQKFEAEQNLKYGDCSEKKGAYCTMLENTDGTKINSTKSTWDQHNNHCIGHLAFINDTKDVQVTDNAANKPSSRFWVGHRIWTFVPINFDSSTVTFSLSPKAEKKNSSDDITDSLTDFISVPPKAEKKKSSDESSNLTLIIAVTVSVIALLVILLTIICIKRRKANLSSSKQPENDSSKDACTVPLQPISEQTNQDHDYDHLHGNPVTLHTDNVYDVSGKCPDESNIDDNVYNTSKQCSGHEMYDSSINNPQKSENVMNSDMYSTLSRNNGGECPKDMNLYDHTSTSAQNNDRTDIYNEIDT